MRAFPATPFTSARVLLVRPELCMLCVRPDAVSLRFCGAAKEIAILVFVWVRASSESRAFALQVLATVYVSYCVCARAHTSSMPIHHPPPAQTVHSFGFWEPWIALVQRGGNCSFYDKIRHATQAGASAVIIGNVRVSEVVIMHDTRPVQIPAVSVSRAVAAQLEETGAYRFYRVCAH